MVCYHTTLIPDGSCCLSGKGVIRSPFIFVVPSIFERISYYLFYLKESSPEYYLSQKLFEVQMQWKVHFQIQHENLNILGGLSYAQSLVAGTAPSSKGRHPAQNASLQSFLSLICSAQSFTLCFHTQFITWMSLKDTGC